MSLNLAEILHKPIVTERSTQLKEMNKYVFAVSPRATKGQIREAVETAFKVDVLDVNTANRQGKTRRRMGPRSGVQPAWKKAIVTIKSGQQIKYAEPQA
jgi:large subunit ribosomal protein L23